MNWLEQSVKRSKKLRTHYMLGNVDIYVKDQLPEDFKKIEKLSNDLKSYFNTLLETKLFDEYKIQDLKSSLKKSLDRINKIHS